MARSLDLSPVHRRVLLDAWRISWGHKHLWLFGFFGTFLGYGGVSEVFFGAYNRAANFLPATLAGGSPFDLIPGMTAIAAIIRYSPFPALSVGVFGLTALLLFAVFAWIATVSIGALIANARKIERGGDPGFADGLKVGAERFWDLFRVQLASKLVIGIAYLVTASTLYGLIVRFSALGAFLYLIAFVAFTAVAVVASVVSTFASNESAVRKTRPVSALITGWDLFSRNWLVSVELIGVMLVASAAIALVTILIGVVAIAPLAFLFILSTALDAAGAAAAVVSAAIIVLVVLVAIAASFLTAFQAAAWTLFWSELTERRPAPKLARLAHAIRHALTKRK